VAVPASETLKDAYGDSAESDDAFTGKARPLFAFGSHRSVRTAPAGTRSRGSDSDSTVFVGSSARASVPAPTFRKVARENTNRDSQFDTRLFRPPRYSIG
jgi:hypothetical protein